MIVRVTRTHSLCVSLRSNWVGGGTPQAGGGGGTPQAGVGRAPQRCMQAQEGRRPGARPHICDAGAVISLTPQQSIVVQRFLSVPEAHMEPQRHGGALPSPRKGQFMGTQPCLLHFTPTPLYHSTALTWGLYKGVCNEMGRLAGGSIWWERGLFLETATLLSRDGAARSLLLCHGHISATVDALGHLGSQLVSDLCSPGLHGRVPLRLRRVA